MPNYKYELRKHGAQIVCPNCGRKRFVPFVLTADGRTIATDANGAAIFGRCNREQKCGYFRRPDKSAPEKSPLAPLPPAPRLQFSPAAVRTDISTNLFPFAASLMGVARATEVWQRYKIGNDRGRTLFWQIDENGVVRAGKSIPYGLDGHRLKDDPRPAAWAHKERSFDGLHNHGELAQCYFGEHLLPQYPDAGVAIVESEKTAAFLSAYTAPEKWIWLASGGASGIKNETKNKPLRNRRVLLIPDNGFFWAWDAIARKNGWAITQALEYATAGADILDLLVAGALGNDLLYNTSKK